MTGYYVTNAALFFWCQHKPREAGDMDKGLLVTLPLFSLHLCSTGTRAVELTDSDVAPWDRMRNLLCCCEADAIHTICWLSWLPM